MMKRRMMLLLALTFVVSVYAQKENETTKNWKYTANVGLNLSQTSFNNWALGGEGSVGGIGIVNLGANYAKGKYSWNNSFAGQYGLQKIDGQETKKSIDVFELTSLFGYQIKKHWSLAVQLGLKSQFAKGYEYPKAGGKNKISNFLAPGYINTSLGFNYVPNDWFSVFLSPITGKHTLVLDEALSDAGSFGVDKGDKYKCELGALVEAKMKKDIMKNINLITSLRLFSAYDSFGNVDVVWDLALAMKVNKYISATISTNLLYDDDISSKIQFKEVIGVGLAYTISK